MSPQQHNKFLAIVHLVYSGFYLLLAIGFSLFFFFVFSAIPDQPGHGDPPPFWFFVFFSSFFLFFYGALMVPSIVAGYALLKQRRWAKTAAIIAGVLAAMQFQIGTAVCVYTFWFLFSEPGKVLYEKPTYALPPPPPVWNNQSQMRSEDQHLPRTPPDWR